MHRTRPLNIILIIIVLIIFVMFGFYFVSSRNSTWDSPPEIIFEDDINNELSVDVTEHEIFKGVTAIDKEDGDVTDNMIIESISPFTSNNIRIITYVAFDSSNNVTKETRKISYTDYTSPKIIELSKPEITEQKVSEILKFFKAEDVIDGDISEKIKVINLTQRTNNPNIFDLELSVTNSCGDTTKLESVVNLVK